MSIDAIAQLCAQAADLRAFRTGILQIVARVVPFEAALFHALSPRVPLATGVFVGIDPAALAASVGSWDEFGSLFDAIRERAHREGVATDAELPRAARQAFRDKVGRPLGQRSLCMGHLVVRGRFVAALALFSKRERAFGPTQLAQLQRLLPAIAAGDALHQLLDHVPMATVPTRLACSDQRLTPRQRELVELVAMGHTNAQIGDALGLSTHAVRNHLVRVFARLGAANRADVVRLAVLTATPSPAVDRRVKPA